MQYLWIFPALLLYTFVCGLIIHLIEDRHNRAERRRAYYRKTLNVRNLE